MISCPSYLNSMSNKVYKILVHSITFNIIVFNQQKLKKAGAALVITITSIEEDWWRRENGRYFHRGGGTMLTYTGRLRPKGVPFSGSRYPCIRLARGKFELTNQDSAGGKNFSVLTSIEQVRKGTEIKPLFSLEMELNIHKK